MGTLGTEHVADHGAGDDLQLSPALPHLTQRRWSLQKGDGWAGCPRQVSPVPRTSGPRSQVGVNGTLCIPEERKTLVGFQALCPSWLPLGDCGCYQGSLQRRGSWLLLCYTCTLSSGHWTLTWRCASLPGRHRKPDLPQIRASVSGLCSLVLEHASFREEILGRRERSTERCEPDAGWWPLSMPVGWLETSVLLVSFG